MRLLPIHHRAAPPLTPPLRRPQELAERDEEMKAQYAEILGRFFSLFDSMYRYVQDFLQFIEDVREGIFIQHTLESMLFNTTGKQLMAEAVYLLSLIHI